MPVNRPSSLAKANASNNASKTGTTLTADHFTHLDQFGADLWKLADALRANSGLASNEYFMPILGLLFLRHASNRYYAARDAIAADQTAGRTPMRWRRCTRPTPPSAASRCWRGRCSRASRHS
jgi:hypothetical protein